MLTTPASAAPTRSLRPSCQDDLAALLGEVRAVPVAGVVSGGPIPIRNAVARAVPGVPWRYGHGRQRVTAPNLPYRCLTTVATSAS